MWIATYRPGSKPLRPDLLKLKPASHIRVLPEPDSGKCRVLVDDSPLGIPLPPEQAQNLCDSIWQAIKSGEKVFSHLKWELAYLESQGY